MGSGIALASSSSGIVGREEVVAGIQVARDAMSARIYNLAKRPDEDCVRSMAEGVVREFPDLPEDAVVTMKQSNDESIHQHNAHAERVAEFGDLVGEVNGDAD